MLEPIRLKGVPLTDPAWAAARRGHPAVNAGQDMRGRALSADDVRALLRACGRRSPSAKRDRALIGLLWRGGVRVGEAVGRDFRPRSSPKGPQPATRHFPGLFARDIDLASGLIYITYGKGSSKAPYKPRTVAIDPGAIALLEVWLAERRRLGIPPTVQLFCTISDDAHRYGDQWRPLTGVYVRAKLKRLARAAELDARVHPHALRHTMAFELSMERQPMNLIQQQLGHESLATTSRYLAHIAPQLLAEVMTARVMPPGV